MCPRTVLPTPAEMVAHLDSLVAGQPSAKQALASAVYRHYLGLALRQRGPSARGLGPQHVLLLGPTGVGKTLMVRTLADELGVPVLFTSATTLVETGYVGDHVETLFEHLRARADGSATRAARGIIFLDEFDKIRASRDGFRDVSGEGVQNALLTVLDGRRVQLRPEHGGGEIDASSVLFVAAGAFVGLEEHVERRLGGAPALGFHSRDPRTRARVPVDAPRRTADGEPGAPGRPSLHRVLPQDLVRFGFIPELIGRFPTIAAVDPLSEDDLVHILRHTGDSVITRERELFELHGVRLEFTTESLRDIARDALRRGTGARGLAARVREILQPLSWRLPELAHEGVTVAVVDAQGEAGVVPRLVRGRSRRDRSGADLLRAEAFGPADGAGSAHDRRTATSARERLRWLRDHALGWSQTSAETRAWWELMLQVHSKRPEPLAEFANGLMKRKATLEEARAAAREAGCDSLEAWLHLLDFRRARAAWERAAEEARKREERARARKQAKADELTLPFDDEDGGSSAAAG